MTDFLPTNDDQSELAQWARPFLELDDVPAFGSPEWLALDPCDQRRAAAVVRAAMGWYRAIDPTVGRESVDELEANGEAMWSGIALRAGFRTHAQAAQERALSTYPREGDHPGGPVAPW